MLLEEPHALLSPTRSPHSGRDSPLNLKLVSDPHSSDLAKFFSAKRLSGSHPSPTFIGHNFMDELSYSPAKPAQVTCSALVQAVKDKNTAAAEQARAVTGPLKVVKAAATGPLKAAKAGQAKVAFCSLSKALQGEDYNVAAKVRLHTSQYRGVSKRESGRWTARIKQNNKDIAIGRFDTELAAAQAYDKARLKYGGRYGLVRPLLNFPSDSPRSAAAKKILAKPAEQLVPGSFVQAVPQFTCKHPGCGKVYSSSDCVRKHCRREHRDWLSSLSSRGPETYCSWEECP